MQYGIKKIREVWIDNARAFAMIAVIWMHTANIGIKDNILPTGMILSFNMPLFVFISGYCAYHTLERICQLSDFWKYIKKLTICIGVPNLCYWAIDYGMSHSFQMHTVKTVAATIVLLTLMFYAYLLYSHRLNAYCENLSLIIVLLSNFSSIFNSFWFLTFILKTSVIAGFCALASKKANNNHAVFILLFSFMMIVCPGSFHATLELFTYYLLGLLAYKKNWFLAKSKYLLMFVCCGVSLYVILFNFKLGNINFYYHDAFNMIKNGEGVGYLYRQILAILAIFSIMSFFKICNRKYKGPFFSLIGMYTLAIYPIHAIIINIIKEMGGANTSSCLAYPVFVVILTVASLLLVKVLKQNKFLSCLFLGKIK